MYLKQSKEFTFIGLAFFTISLVYVRSKSDGMEQVIVVSTYQWQYQCYSVFFIKIHKYLPVIHAWMWKVLICFFVFTKCVFITCLSTLEICLYEIVQWFAHQTIEDNMSERKCKPCSVRRVTKAKYLVPTWGTSIPWATLSMRIDVQIDGRLGYNNNFI